MCQSCQYVTRTVQSQAGGLTALDSHGKKDGTDLKDLLRLINSRDYSGNVWNGKKKLSLELPPSDPMDWMPTNPEVGVAAGYWTEKEADYESDALVNPYIRVVSCLEGSIEYPHADHAADLMIRVCAELRWIMKEEEWTVDHLTEFYPFEGALRGMNHKAGTIIHLRLRDPMDKAAFRPFTEIMWTAIHELSHNRYSNHDGDFYDLWDDLNTRHGIPGGRALYLKQQNPKQPLPADHVVILVNGQKILMQTDDVQKHFSACVDKCHPKLKQIQLPGRKFSTSVVVRLAQLAKGLDPADDKPLYQISNSRDYWNTENDCFGFADEFNDTHLNATRALHLYLQMYKTGEELGWHVSSREWLTKQFGRALIWDCRYWSGPWVEPKVQSCEEATARLVEMVRLIYQETTVQDQYLRVVVVGVLRAVHEVCRKKGQLMFDTSILDELMYSIPELRDDLQLVKMMGSSLTSKGRFIECGRGREESEI